MGRRMQLWTGKRGPGRVMAGGWVCSRKAGNRQAFYYRGATVEGKLTDRIVAGAGDDVGGR